MSLFSDPEMAREARDKIALGVMPRPRTNNEPRSYYVEVCMCNARCHPAGEPVVSHITR